MIRHTARALSRRLLPAPIKRRLASWRFGELRAGGVDWIDASEDSEFVRIDGSLVVRAVGSFGDELRYHLERSDSRAELGGLIADARSHSGFLLDIGAHKGLFGVLFCLARPDNRALMLEPSPSSAAVAQRAIAANHLDPRVHLLNVAAAEHPGRIRVVDEPLGFAQLTDDPTAGVEVEVVTVDALCEKLAVRPTSIKIDVEGAELDVLRGAANTLETVRPSLFLEIHMDLLEQRRSSATELCDFLGRFGYRFFFPSGRALRPLAVRQSLKAIQHVVARVEPHR
jgi:FkbM family methyltransferase